MLNRIIAAAFALIGFLIGGVLTGIINPGLERLAEAPVAEVETPASAEFELKLVMSRNPPKAVQTVSFPAAPAPDAPVHGYGPDEEGPTLWRVSDADSVMWLLGTVHALSADVNWRSPEVEAAVAQAQTVFFESDLAVDLSVREIRQLQRLATYRNGPPLTERLSRNARLRLLRAARRLGVPQSDLMRARPWNASLILGAAMARKAGMERDLGVENVLASGLGDRQTRYLEDGVAVLTRLAEIPEDEQIAELEKALIAIDDNPYRTAAIEEAWAEGDQARITEIVLASMPEDSATYRVMIRDRNHAWAETLVEHLEGDGVSLVAVGAAHLVGPDRVQRLLEDAGYTVDRF